MADTGFTMFFLLELLLRLTASGFCGKDSFFKSWWNLLDILVVVLGLVTDFQLRSCTRHP